jgi:hypothetical protein
MGLRAFTAGSPVNSYLTLPQRQLPVVGILADAMVILGNN